jgi:hypothetical protein
MKSVDDLGEKPIETAKTDKWLAFSMYLVIWGSLNSMNVTMLAPTGLFDPQRYDCQTQHMRYVVAEHVQNHDIPYTVAENLLLLGGAIALAKKKE